MTLTGHVYAHRWLGPGVWPARGHAVPGRLLAPGRELGHERRRQRQARTRASTRAASRWAPGAARRGDRHRGHARRHDRPRGRARCRGARSTGAITVAAWGSATSFSGRNPRLVQKGVNDSQYRLLHRGRPAWSGSRRRGPGDGRPARASTRATSTWAPYDRATLRLYLDGSQVASLGRDRAHPDDRRAPRDRQQADLDRCSRARGRGSSTRCPSTTSPCRRLRWRSSCGRSARPDRADAPARSVSRADGDRERAGR